MGHVRRRGGAVGGRGSACKKSAGSPDGQLDLQAPGREPWGHRTRLRHPLPGGGERPRERAVLSATRVEEKLMAKVVWHVTMSLDGFIAGPGGSSVSRLRFEGRDDEVK